MCAGAILQARIPRLVFGARNKRLGAAGSWIQLLPRARTQGSTLSDASFVAAQDHSSGHSRNDVVADHIAQAEAALDLAGRADAHGDHENIRRPQLRMSVSRTKELIGQSTAASVPPSLPWLLPEHGNEQGADVHMQKCSRCAQGDRLRQPVAGQHPYHLDMVVECGVAEQECADLLQAFFRQRRRGRKLARSTNKAWLLLSGAKMPRQRRS